MIRDMEKHKAGQEGRVVSVDGGQEDCNIQIVVRTGLTEEASKLWRRCGCEPHWNLGEQLRGSRKAKPLILLPRFEEEQRGQCSRAGGSGAGRGSGQSWKGWRKGSAMSCGPRTTGADSEWEGSWWILWSRQGTWCDLYFKWLSLVPLLITEQWVTWSGNGLADSSQRHLCLDKIT